jgi:RNA polymerase sigma factor (sigma-70 family)
MCLPWAGFWDKIGFKFIFLLKTVTNPLFLTPIYENAQNACADQRKEVRKMESLEEIYQKHAQTVYAFLLSRTRNQDLAEELTQETFFQAVRTIDTFRGDSKLSTWLCGIARNLWLAHLRESRRTQPLEETADMAKASSPEEELSLQWDNLEILKLLHGLKEPAREVMYLRLIGNLTFGQIGEIMGKSENWARVNFYRGKEIIRREAEKHET